MTERSLHLEGHVAPSDPLSPRAAFAAMPKLVRPLVRYAPADPWEKDTASLPWDLAKHRRAMRSFAERHLARAALSVDAEPHRPPGDLGPAARSVLQAAAREGLLTDMLPRPLGSAPPTLFRHPLYFPAALKTE